jgi:hypothetical protein
MVLYSPSDKERAEILALRAVVIELLRATETLKPGTFAGLMQMTVHGHVKPAHDHFFSKDQLVRQYLKDLLDDSKI